MSCTVTAVEAEADGEGCLVVRWRLDSADAVSIGVGPTPDSDSHEQVLLAEAGTDRARLSGLPPGRHYVSVTPRAGGAPVIAAERCIVFEGPRNFRDLGGYPTMQGASVSWGTVFRADALHQMTQADQAMFGTFGIRVVYDLRSSSERSLHPDPMESVAVDLLSALPGETNLQLGTSATRLDAERLLRDSYVGMLASSAPLFGQLFTGLADPAALPAVFHCAAGKDRTGLTAALLLSALGVDRETVLDDYELTTNWRPRLEAQTLLLALVRAGIPEEAADGLLGTPRWAMSEVLRVLDETYGGINAYLSAPGGMNGEAIADLKRKLTISAR